MKTLFCQIFLLFYVGISVVSAQKKQGQARIDSLLAQFPKIKSDTARIRLLISISSEYSYINSDEGIKAGNKALALAEKLNWQKGKADAMNAIGTNYEGKSDYVNALKFYFSALQLYEKSGDKKGITASLGNIGIVYDYQSDYAKALEYYFRVIKMCEESGNRHGLAAYYGNIGVVYKNQSKYTEALQYQLKALEINDELGDDVSKAINLSNIGVIYDAKSNLQKH